jgi:hypothetical protein
MSFLQSTINSQHSLAVNLERVFELLAIAKKHPVPGLSVKLPLLNGIFQRLLVGGLATLTEIPMTHAKFSSVLFKKLLLDSLMIILACKFRGDDERLNFGMSRVSIDLSLNDIRILLNKIKPEIITSKYHLFTFENILSEHLKVLASDKSAREHKIIIRSILQDLSEMQKESQALKS